LIDGRTGKVIGGTSPGARNVMVTGAVGGFVALIYNRSDNTVIQGNYLGVNAAGTAALGSNDRGIHVSAGVGVTVGGTSSGAGNVINGVSFGVIVDPENLSHPNNAVVQGNLIGTDATGTVAFHTLNVGIQVGPTVNTTIGGSTAAAANVISGTNTGILIVGNPTGVAIQGNKIGTDISGTKPLGNSGAGIDVGVTGGASTTAGTIGGTGAGEGNIIAFNGGIGVVIGSGNTGWSIQGNSIFSNTGIGIDLNADGVTLNDTGDTDSGANNLQNFPVLTSVSSSGGMTTIGGTLNSAANTMYRIEFFANDAIDPTGYGEGQTYLGFKDVMTNGSGNVSFNTSVAQIGAQQRVTATATDPDGNTSEFSGSIGQLLNISTRMEVLTGSSVLIGGFIISGTGNMQVLMRALGPTLTQFGVQGVLMDPMLELHDGTGALVTSNDNWKDTQQAAISATGLAPPNDLESAILHTFTPGNYTGIVRGKNNTTGIGLIEAYDITKSVAITLTNISTRGFVDTDQNVMIGGLISGNGIVRVIIRALGPTLSQFGVTNVLADPTLELHDGNGTLLASNDNWKDTQQAEIQASGFAPPNDAESAIIAVRPASNSTAIVRGKNNTTGNALVECYILPP
jgi:hypothetical protein